MQIPNEFEGPIYLDNHATTAVDSRVKAAMLPFLEGEFGNPGSRTHRFGQRARRAVDDARAAIAKALSATAAEIVLTSGATESLNLAIRGLARHGRGQPGRRVVCFAADHSATLACVEATADDGMVPLVLPVDTAGRPDLAALQTALAQAGQGGTLAVCVTAVHNELGVVAPVAAIAAQCRIAGALLIVDAAQAPGRIRIDVDAWDADLVAVTAHKCYGPKGAGALFVRRRNRTVALAPLMVGGGQEQGLRPGTLAVAQVAGLAQALVLADAERDDDNSRITGLRDQLWLDLASLEGARRNSSGDDVVAGNLSAHFDGVDVASLLVALPDLALSAGSACASGTPRPSAALLAIGLDERAALSTVRICVGRFNTAAEITFAGLRLREAIEQQRAASPLWAMRHDRAALDALGWGGR